MSRFDLANLYAVVAWAAFFGSTYAARRTGTLDPVEARAKAWFTLILTAAIYVGLFLNAPTGWALCAAAFVAYFVAKGRLR